MFRKLFPAIIVMALALSACSLHISLPVTVKVGPTVTDRIDVPAPDSSEAVHLTLDFGAGKLKLHSGAESVVSGTATYNISDFKPVITTEGSTVTVTQGNWRITGIPDLNTIKNEWDLALGSMPIDLSIKGGAYHAEYDFGGLALTKLDVSDGASDVKMDFSAPNKAEMSLLRYETGASNVSLVGLGNANFSSLVFNSGAGNYTLDFTGALQRDGSVTVKTGFSNLTLVIPAGVPAQVTVESGLSNVSYDSGWTRNGSVYSQSGSGPKLTILVDTGAGNLTITR